MAKRNKFTGVSLSDWPDESADYKEHYDFAVDYLRDDKTDTVIPLKYKQILINKTPVCDECALSTAEELYNLEMGAAVCKCCDKKVEWNHEPHKPQPIVWTTEEEIEADDHDHHEDHESEAKLRKVDQGRFYYWHQKYRNY